MIERGGGQDGAANLLSAKSAEAVAVVVSVLGAAAATAAATVQIDRVATDEAMVEGVMTFLVPVAPKGRKGVGECPVHDSTAEVRSVAVPRHVQDDTYIAELEAVEVYSVHPRYRSASRGCATDEAHKRVWSVVSRIKATSSLLRHGVPPA